MKLSYTLPLALSSFLCLCPDARADADETRLSIIAGGGFASVAAFDGTGDTPTYGAGLAIAHGFQNWFDAGLALRYHAGSDILLDGGQLDGVGGDPQHEFYTDLQVFDGLVAARGYLEVGPFLRLRPVAGVRAGIRGTRYANAALFAGNALVATADTEWDVALVAGGEVGLAYRLTDMFEMAVLLGGERVGTLDSFSLTFEFSWQRG